MAEKKELSMEKRLLLAFLLMGLVLFITPYLYKNEPAAPGPKAAQTTKPAQTDTTKPPPAIETPAPVEIPGQVQAGQEEVFAIDTELFHVEFSNRGAVARRWVLKNFRDQQNKPVDLVYQQALQKVPAPFSLAFKGQNPGSDPNVALFKIDRPDPLTANFEYSDGHVAVKKTFKFKPDSYLVAISSQVSRDGAPLPHSLEWRGGFGDSTIVNAATNEQAVYYDVSNSKLNVKTPKDAKDGPVSSAGSYTFAGLQDSYFASVFLPEGRSLVEITTYSDAIPGANGSTEQRVGASVGGEGNNSFTYFVGPKDYQLLHRINPKLDQLIDWSWLGISLEFIAKPIFLAMSWTADHITHNYGLAIILITVVINFVLFPLKLSSMKSAKKQQTVQPLIAAINEKYKNIPMRDPRQADKNQEMMDLYKKHGINPVGGCLPMLLTLPFFVAFYKVLSVSIQLRGAGFLWVHDLSQPETLPIRMLPVILVITQFLSQKMTPTPGMDPAQQKMMMFMPLMLGYMFYFASAGLVLYWLTSNVVGIAQQWVLNRRLPPPAVVDVKPPPKKNRK
jgi:YidC/Oxa1 family membrane protein insertase